MSFFFIINFVVWQFVFAKDIYLDQYGTNFIYAQPAKTLRIMLPRTAVYHQPTKLSSMILDFIGWLIDLKTKVLTSPISI